MLAPLDDWDDDDDVLIPNSYEHESGTKLVATNCIFCGRALRDPESIERGCGPDCAERWGAFRTAGPVDRKAVEGLLRIAEQKQRKLAEIVTEFAADPRSAVSRLLHAAGFAWERRTRDYAVTLALTMDFAVALGYPGTADGIRRTLIEGRNFDARGREAGKRKPKGVVISEQDGRWFIDLPYIESRAAWGNIMRAIYQAGGKQEPGYRASFAPRQFRRILNALVDGLAGTIGALPDGKPFVVPFEKIVIPDEPPAPGQTSGTPASEQRPRFTPEQVPKGSVITLNDGRTGVVKWTGASRGEDRIGFVTEPNGPMQWAGLAEVTTSEVPKRVREEVAANTGNDAALTMPMPELPDIMYSYQKEGAAWLFERRSGILAFEQGLGKTLTSAAVTIAPAVVVCPASVRPNWVKEFARWRPDLVVTAQGLAGNGSQFTDSQLKADVCVLSYHALGENMDALAKRGIATLIVDEAQRCKELILKRVKDPTTQRWSEKPGGSAQSQRVLALARAAERRYFLTGTPLVNGRPYELWPLLHMCDPRKWWSQKQYWRRFCLRVKESKGGRLFYDHHGALHLDELREATQGKYLLRKTKDVLDLPEKWRQQLLVAMESKWAARYRAASESILDYIRQTRGREAETAALRAKQLVMFNELMKILSMGKIEAMVEFIVQHWDSTGRPLVVMAHHRDAIQEIVKRLKEERADLRVGLFTGDQNPTQKEANKVAFQEEGTIDVLVCSILAAGVGITLTRAQEMVFLERTWVPFDMLQAEDRIHRIGQKNKCTYTYIDCAGTIDEVLHNVMRQKVETATAVVAGEGRESDVGWSGAGTDQDSGHMMEDLIASLEGSYRANPGGHAELPEWADPW